MGKSVVIVRQIIIIVVVFGAGAGAGAAAAGAAIAAAAVVVVCSYYSYCCFAAFMIAKLLLSAFSSETPSPQNNIDRPREVLPRMPAAEEENSLGLCQAGSNKII